MPRYRIIKRLQVGPGAVLQLDEKQAARRKGRIEPLGQGRYRAQEVLDLKVGEIVGLEFDLPKVHLDSVEKIDDDGAVKTDKPVSTGKPRKGALLDGV